MKLSITVSDCDMVEQWTHEVVIDEELNDPPKLFAYKILDDSKTEYRRVVLNSNHVIVDSDSA